MKSRVCVCVCEKMCVCVKDLRNFSYANLPSTQRDLRNEILQMLEREDVV